MIFSGAISAAFATFVRKCPKCGGRQAVSMTKKSQTIDCKSCGASIPPSQNADSDRRD